MALVFYACCVIIASVIAFLQIRFNRVSSILSKIPAPRKLFLLQNLPAFINLKVDDFLPWMESWREKLGSVFHFSIYPFHSGLIFVMDPVTADELLAKTKKPVKPWMYNVVKGLLGEGLFAVSGEKWEREHKVMINAFNGAMLKMFLIKINQHDDKFVELIRAKVDEPIDVVPLVTNLAMDIIFDCATGFSLNAQSKPKSGHVQAVKLMSGVMVERVFSPLKMFDFYYRFTATYRKERKILKSIHGLTNEIVEFRKKQMAMIPDDDKPESLLDILLRNESTLSLEETRDALKSFIYGGHDTLTSADSFLLFMLAKHPAEQQKAYDEVMKYFCDDNKPLSIAGLNQMSYLDAFIKETLRLYPSVPFYGRTVTEDITAGPFTFPKGADIFFSPYLMGRDSDIYPNPMEFNPNRFIEKNLSELPDLQFSGGVRACVGKKFSFFQMKSMISKVLINFELKLQHPDHEIEAVMRLALAPSQNPEKIIFTKRMETF